MERTSVLGKAVALLSRAWRVFGFALALVVVAELVGRCVFLYRDQRHEAKLADRIAAEVHDADWVKDYLADERSLTRHWHPYVYYRQAPFAGKAIQIDDRGLRRTVGPAPSPATNKSTARRAPRVFMFGGSTMWGAGVRDAYTIPSILAQLLDNQGENAEITNFAQPDYISQQCLLALLDCLQRGDTPDVVVFYSGMADTRAAHRSGVAGVPADEAHRRLAMRWLQDADSSQPFKPLSGLQPAMSGLFPAMTRMGRTLRGDPVETEPGGADLAETVSRSEADDKRLADVVVRQYVSVVNAVEALAQTYGFQAVFYWEPTLRLKPQRTDAEQRELERDPTLLPLLDEVYRLIPAERQLAARANFVDLSHLFHQERNTFFLEGGRGTEAGNRRVAEKIIATLVPRMSDRK